MAKKRIEEVIEAQVEAVSDAEIAAHSPWRGVLGTMEAALLSYGIDRGRVVKLLVDFEERILATLAPASEGTDREVCPTFTLSADSEADFAMLIHLSHSAPVEIYRALRLKVREFELWREANK